MPTVGGYLYDINGNALSGISIVYQEAEGYELVTQTTGASGEFSLTFTTSPGFLFLNDEKYWLEPIWTNFTASTSGHKLYANQTETFALSGVVDYESGIYIDCRLYYRLIWGAGTTKLKYPKNRHYFFQDWDKPRNWSDKVVDDTYQLTSLETASINFTSTGATTPVFEVVAVGAYPYLVEKETTIARTSDGLLNIYVPGKYIIQAVTGYYGSTKLGGFAGENGQVFNDEGVKVFNFKPGDLLNLHFDFRDREVFYTTNTTSASALPLDIGVPVRDSKARDGSKWYQFNATANTPYEVILFQKTKVSITFKIRNASLTQIGDYKDKTVFIPQASETHYIEVYNLSPSEYNIVVNELGTSTGSELTD